MRTIIAGPCAVESKEQIIRIGNSVRDSGATHLRYMVFKPRTHPESFQGIGYEGLYFAQEVFDEVGLPLVTEVLDTRDVTKVAKYVQVIQIGSRSMHSSSLLREIGLTGKEVVLKRGMSATLDEWEGAFDYLNLPKEKVFMCERGVRSATTEGYTRNLLDLSIVPVLHARGYKTLVDPSHGTGRRELVIPLSRAALVVGANGLEIEVHDNPSASKSDPLQAINLDEFRYFMKNIEE